MGADWREAFADRCQSGFLAAQQGQGGIQHAVDGAEQAGMASRTAKGKGVLVMHLAAHDPAAPGAVFGWQGFFRWRVECQAGGQGLVGKRMAGQAFDGDAEEHEVYIGIDRRAGGPDALEDEGAQGGGVLTVGIKRLDRGQVGLVAEALAIGDATFGGLHVVLPQVGDGGGERLIQIETVGGGEAKDRRGGEQHLGEGCQVEPTVALGEAEGFNRAFAVGGDHAEGGAGDGGGDRFAEQIDGVEKALCGCHGGIVVGGEIAARAYL